jgi:radical SAM superfamily enzyme YgiQ (UPF0313 family)
VRYIGKIYRPPSEAHSYLLQATIGCSWNHCTYCDMYRDKPVFRPRPLAETLEDIDAAARQYGPQLPFDKVFVMDGDALCLPAEHFASILERIRVRMPGVRQVSCYATAGNVAGKADDELRRLRTLGLSLLYIGPESGDDVTLKRIAKGADFAAHAEAAQRARAAGFALSTIFLLGAGGVERSTEHAEASGRLVTAMDPDYVSALTLTLVPGTPIDRLARSGRFTLPDVAGLLGELRTLVDVARPTGAVFRTNHASNYLPLAGRLPEDRARIVAAIDAALDHRVPLRPEWARGL